MMNTPFIIPAGTRVMVPSHVYKIQYHRPQRDFKDHLTTPCILQVRTPGPREGDDLIRRLTGPWVFSLDLRCRQGPRGQEGLRLRPGCFQLLHPCFESKVLIRPFPSTCPQSYLPHYIYVKVTAVLLEATNLFKMKLLCNQKIFFGMLTAQKRRLQHLFWPIILLASTCLRWLSTISVLSWESPLGFSPGNRIQQEPEQSQEESRCYLQDHRLVHPGEFPWR